MSKRERTMSARTGRIVTVGIIGLCLLALLFIFQPLVPELFTAGCIMVVVGGLAFNMVPYANPQNTVRRMLKVGLIVIVILVVAVAIAIGFVEILL